MSNLFIEVVEAVKLADARSKELGALMAKVTDATDAETSAVEVACVMAHTWFLGTNKKHGGKKQLADAAQVSDKTIGRYIASGHVAMVTSGKVSASVANSAISNYDMKTTEVERVNSVTDWNKLLKACKAVKKSGAGKVAGKAPTEPTEAEAPASKSQGWEALAEALAEVIASGEVDLMTVAEYLTELVASKELVEV
jgi:hypothetical protein